MRAAFAGVFGLAVAAVLGSGCLSSDTQVYPNGLPDAGVADGPASGEASVDRPAARVEDLLEPLRAGSGVPGMAALVLHGGVVIAEGATGVRKLGDPTPVTSDDAWYLGTAAEAFTATLAALVVESGKLAWTSTLGAVLPDVPMHASYKDVSLELLLGHRGGAPPKIPDAILQGMRAAGTPDGRRDAGVRALLAAGPETAPASDVQLSDAGYLLAAAMLERAAGATWETMLRARVLDPLGMTGCRYDPLPNAPAIVEPWGHALHGDVLQGVPPGSAAEPPPALGPAGRVRCPLRDWAKLCAVHLAGARGEPTALLGAASIVKLQTPTKLTVALGWNAVFQTWAGSARALTHASWNPLYSAVVWLAPEKDLAFLVVTNEADDISLAAADRVVGELVARFVPR
jgi:D-alanyl-D-alanine carboxypeptidase